MTHGIDVNHEHFPGNYEQQLPPNMQRLKQVSTQHDNYGEGCSPYLFYLLLLYYLP
jgi:hypothetical protein